jgi:hypothetical protein
MEGQLVANRSAAGRLWQGDLGQFFTRASVARCCLDQLTLPANLLTIKLLEPSAGHGAFFLPIIPKLVRACRLQKRPYSALQKVFRAYEIDPAVAASLRQKCIRALEENGVPSLRARSLARYWVRNEDFLEARFRSCFSHIVGNPPYIRWEAIPAKLRASYKQRFLTFKQRADLYVAFIERGLELLQSDGQMGLLCPGNWTRNVYGSSIRKLLTSKGYLKKIIDFSGVDSFEQSADAYPCFFIFQRGSTGATQIFSMADGEKLSRAGDIVTRRFGPSSSPLLLSLNNEIDRVVRRARTNFPSLDEAGCSVRVGSATGCNDVFLGSSRDLPVEKDRLLPFVNARSIRDGIVQWSGTSIVNVFDENGQLVKLDRFPRLGAYLQRHKEVLRARYKASRSKFWWPTIDVLHPDWYRLPKLLVVDISAKPVVGLDAKGYCAGSGVYQIKSKNWPLDDLLVLLSAGVLGLFTSGSSAATPMPFHRFQKQQISAVPIPKWEELDEQWRTRFQGARIQGDLAEILSTVAELYDCEPVLLREHVARDWEALNDRPKA